LYVPSKQKKPDAEMATLHRRPTRAIGHSMRAEHPSVPIREPSPTQIRSWPPLPERLPAPPPPPPPPPQPERETASDGQSPCQPARSPNSN
jgi:hypothetical protein